MASGLSVTWNRKTIAKDPVVIGNWERLSAPRRLVMHSIYDNAKFNWCHRVCPFNTVYRGCLLLEGSVMESSTVDTESH